MRIYEEYDTPQEKRKAQKGAKRGKATGKARGYLLVFNEDGYSGTCEATYGALGELMAGVEPGDEPRVITSCNPHVDFLRTHCRFIGWDTVPEVWKRAIARKLWDMIPDEEDQKPYAKILRWRNESA